MTTTVAPVSKRPYLISCAACGARGEFLSSETLEQWAMQHQCWPPAVHPSLQPEQQGVRRG